MDEILNTDSILAELQKKVDEVDVQIEIIDQRDKSTDLRDTLRGPSFSITDDDLI